MTIKEKGLQKYKHIFFDLDGTLTKSRSLMDLDIRDSLMDLMIDKDVAVISGATKEQIKRQLMIFAPSDFYIMAQSGNDVEIKGEVVWQNFLSIVNVLEVLEHLSHLLYREYRHNFLKADRFEARGSQVSYSFVGHNNDLKVKKKFDPDGSKRKKMLDRTPLVSDFLEVNIGGTTCLDYTLKGFNKRGNINRLIKENGWKKEDCLYVGDQLFEGGNDANVVGLIDTIQVENPDETYKLLLKYYEEKESTKQKK